jgi:hypothetical protein
MTKSGILAYIDLYIDIHPVAMRLVSNIIDYAEAEAEAELHRNTGGYRDKLHSLYHDLLLGAMGLLPREVFMFAYGADPVGSEYWGMDTLLKEDGKQGYEKPKEKKL